MTKRPPWPTNLSGGVPDTMWGLYLDEPTLQAALALSGKQGLVLFRWDEEHSGRVRPVLMPATFMTPRPPDSGEPIAPWEVQ